LFNRQCRLIFQGAPLVFFPVSVGTPQGSPVSPLLFVIYVSCLHISIPRGVIFSYVDDFSVTVASGSYRSNVRRLQCIFSLLSREASRMGVSFSVPKTELIHWRTQKDRDPPSRLPVCLNSTLFHPSPSLRSRGFWFTASLETTTHFIKRLSCSCGAFPLLKPLAPPGIGLPPYI